MSKQKVSLKSIKSMQPSILLKMINKAKKYIKKTEQWENLCKKYNEDIDIIDLIPTKFGKLDVSASTNHGVVTLNYSLLCDGDFFKDYSYLIHEYTHYFQQTAGKKATTNSDDGDYLHNKYEQEGFQNQVEYIADQFGEGEAENYVDDLLDHHDKNGKEKKKLETVLLDKV